MPCAKHVEWFDDPAYNTRVWIIHYEDGTCKQITDSVAAEIELRAIHDHATRNECNDHS